MHNYVFYIHDSRYSVPHFVAVDAVDDETAVAIAQGTLAESDRYLSIDVVDGDREVAHVER
jgi:hypothetical protein